MLLPNFKQQQIQEVDVAFIGYQSSPEQPWKLLNHPKYLNKKQIIERNVNFSN